MSTQYTGRWLSWPEVHKCPVPGVRHSQAWQCNCGQVWVVHREWLDTIPYWRHATWRERRKLLKANPAPTLLIDSGALAH